MRLAEEVVKFNQAVVDGQTAAPSRPSVPPGALRSGTEGCAPSWHNDCHAAVGQGLLL